MLGACLLYTSQCQCYLYITALEIGYVAICSYDLQLNMDLFVVLLYFFNNDGYRTCLLYTSFILIGFCHLGDSHRRNGQKSR